MSKLSLRVIVVPGPEDVAAAALRYVVEAEREAIARSGMFRIALAGGSTPRRLYELLAASPEPDFANWHVFFGDERWVPAGHADNNARMAREALLERVAIPRHQVHCIDTSAGSPARAAQLYAMTLRRKLAPEPGELPRLDLALLGLGADGHTASLFPASSALAAARGELVAATWVATANAWRVTLTVAVLNASRAVVFLVGGAGKTQALARVFGSSGAEPSPASRIRPLDGALVFVVDEAAAERIDRGVPIERTVETRTAALAD